MQNVNFVCLPFCAVIRSCGLELLSMQLNLLLEFVRLKFEDIHEICGRCV